MISEESRLARTYEQWFPDEAYIEKYKGWVADGKKHMYKFARRIIKEIGELDTITGDGEWIFSKGRKGNWYNPADWGNTSGDDAWGYRIEPPATEGGQFTVTNKYYETLMIIHIYEEDYGYDFEGDEPFEEDADFLTTKVIGPRQTQELSHGGAFPGVIYVPYLVSLNASWGEIPVTYQKVLNKPEFRGWRDYFKDNAYRIEKRSDWNPTIDFFQVGETPYYSPLDGTQTPAGKAEYKDIIPFVELPPDDPDAEEETDYTVWIVIGLIVAGIAFFYFMSRPKKGVETNG